MLPPTQLHSTSAHRGAVGKVRGWFWKPSSPQLTEHLGSRGLLSQTARACHVPPSTLLLLGPAILPRQDLAVGPSAPCISQQGQHLYTTRWEQAQSEKRDSSEVKTEQEWRPPQGAAGGRACLGLSQACQTEGAFCPSLPEQRTLQWPVNAVQELRLPHVGEMLTLLENKSEDRKVPDLEFFMPQWYGSDTHSVKSVL